MSYILHCELICSAKMSVNIRLILFESAIYAFSNIFFSGNGGEIQWCFSQVKGTVEEDITEGKIWLRLIPLPKRK